MTQTNENKFGCASAATALEFAALAFVVVELAFAAEVFADLLVAVESKQKIVPEADAEFAAFVKKGWLVVASEMNAREKDQEEEEKLTGRQKEKHRNELELVVHQTEEKNWKEKELVEANALKRVEFAVP